MSSATRGKKKATGSSGTSSSVSPLAGCCVAFSGNFGAGYTQSSLRSIAAGLGSDVSNSVRNDVTHLITTQSDCDKPSTKVVQANDGGLFIVSLGWLLEAQKQGSKQPEANYSLTARDYRAPSSTESLTNDPKKRQASESPAPDAKKKKVGSDTNAPAMGKHQKAKDWSVQVPVDEECPLSGYGVHVDEDRVIWDAALNQTNAGHNNNKFYRIQLLVGPNNHYQTWTRWGRVGVRGQSAMLGDGSLALAKSMFEKRFKDKSGLAWEDRAAPAKSKKYVYLERNYDPDTDGEDDQADETDAAEAEDRKPPPCTLEPAVQELMQLMFDERLFAATMADMKYDNKKLPLGKLSKATINRGFQALKDLTAIIEGTGNRDEVEDLSNLYFSYIPHCFGFGHPPVINNLAMIKKEIELLENLTDLKDAAKIMKSEINKLDRVHPLDLQFNGLGMQEMTPLDAGGNEFKMLEMYLKDTRGATHRCDYQVEQIFRVERQGELERFNNSAFAGPVRDRRLLWHGSRVTNFGGILSQGLRIAPPEAPVTGYMFGKGVYLADMSSKSANYCHSYTSHDTALLLLCEAELGHPMLELTSSDYEAPENAKKQGCWSTFGKGQTGPSLWKDADCIHPSLKGVKVPSTRRAPPGSTGINSTLLYNEYICYDVAQIRLRYLFRVKIS